MSYKEFNDLISKLVESAVRELTKKEGSTTVRDVSNEEEFNKLISSNKFVVACFYKSECPACKSYIPTFEAASKEFKDAAVFVKIHTKEVKSLSKRYNIVAIPTTVVFMDGSEVSRYEGSMNNVKLMTFLIASGLRKLSEGSSMG
ncbi:MAG: thioredoxin family protein [Sulfolobales archaeon]|nr:thioredoxin family protein [Sulfolobales archaeon]